jgi:hypothetical protein
VVGSTLKLSALHPMAHTHTHTHTPALSPELLEVGAKPTGLFIFSLHTLWLEKQWLLVLWRLLVRLSGRGLERPMGR